MHVPVVLTQAGQVNRRPGRHRVVAGADLDCVHTEIMLARGLRHAEQPSRPRHDNCHDPLNSYLLDLVNREAARRAERSDISALGMVTDARAERDDQLLGGRRP
ncbi:hypothetical protein Atai01_65750 [Amycolatopsis taiwanensis]|uniref:Uncharacterized protein n=1 Tax=Amycolatopsis taiwanensis TaxID=342230 RepID=A0A9W6R5S1_9PSEU|nr:hypothetical protein Atai01_65750 [Amycolatopsis taiwanensis]